MAETPAPQPSPLDRLIQQYLDNKRNGVHPLDQAPLVKGMIETGQITPAELVLKLKELRSKISELAKFADIPEPARRTFLAQKVSYNTLREISSLGEGDQTRLAGEIESGKLPVRKIPAWVKDLLKEKDATTAIPSRAAEGPQLEPASQSAERKTDTGGTPLPISTEEPRDTSTDNPLDRLKRFGKRHTDPAPVGEDDAGKPVSILIMRALIGLVFGIVAFILYLVSARGARAMLDMEKRTGDFLERKGPDKVTLWLTQFAVLLFCLIFFRLRIKQGIHWLRTPGGASTTATPAPVPSTQGPGAAPVPAPNAPPQPAPKSAPPAPVGKRPVPQVTAPAASVLKPPVEVHATVKTPDLIILSWRAVGPKVIYNVYSSATAQLTALRKENAKPLHSNVVTWTPETGLERYWVVVTAVDDQGRESAYSEAIEVVRHPEASGPSNLDKATDVIKKVLPW